MSYTRTSGKSSSELDAIASAINKKCSEKDLDFLQSLENNDLNGIIAGVLDDVDPNMNDGMPLIVALRLGYLDIAKYLIHIGCRIPKNMRNVRNCPNELNKMIRLYHMLLRQSKKID